MKSLVIVESPTKARTISKILGKEYIVKASMGHIRDLPESSSDIPAKYKSEKWARIGIDVNKDFFPLYVVGSKKRKIVSELKKDLANVDELILATDEDREGESISWHLKDVLKPKVITKRIAFHEITESAIKNAIAHPRDINMKIVEAQEARRFLDRLFGYSISPILWKKIKFGLSAGRVQSVALKIIVERELERIAFVKSDYISIESNFINQKNDSLLGKLISIKGILVAESKHFDPKTGKLINENVCHLTSKNVDEIKKKLAEDNYIVEQVIKKSQNKSPFAPYITSSLQIDANRKLKFSSRQTMQVAQKLYELGLITYMRTDSFNIAEDALKGISKVIKENYGDKYYSERKFKPKSKNAQEAHEAIRPAGVLFKTGEELGLVGEQLSLYRLIWKRTIASQMKEAILDLTSVDIQGKKHRGMFRGTGNILRFDGYLKVYGQSNDDGIPLPEIISGEALEISKVKDILHETKPPARYNDASLVKKLEEEGVGRPSTYASIISTITSRGYSNKVDNQLVPTFMAFAVYNFLDASFNNLIELKFTAKMEDNLDEIEKGSIAWKKYLTDFYFGKSGLLDKINEEKLKEVNKELNVIEIKKLSDRYKIVIGQYGPYVIKYDNKGEEIARATIPENVYPGNITNEDLDRVLDAKVKSDSPVMVKESEQIFLKTGRFGPYLQIINANKEIQNFSVPKFINPNSITEEEIKKIVSMPFSIGKYNSSDIKIGYGKFGGYILYNESYTSIPDEKVLNITVEEAIEFITVSESKPKRAYGGKKLIKDFGKVKKKKLQLFVGKYGKYLTWGTKNYSVDKSVEDDKITLEYIEKNIINSL